MKMSYDGGHVLTVIREPGDPAFSGDAEARGESRLLYHLKLLLNRAGFDLIKKRMHKDGHLVDEVQQYLRTRGRTPGLPHIFLHNEYWQLRGLDEDFRRDGRVVLSIVFDALNPNYDDEREAEHRRLFAERLTRLAPEHMAS
jgi:hypothetical protein